MKPYPAFERHKIPHTIVLSDRLVKYLMEIAECKPFLDEALASPLKIVLLRQAKVKAITYSNQIEGNTLSEKQVAELLKNNSHKSQDSEEQEVLNYETAHNLSQRIVEDGQPLNKHDFLNLQKLITAGQIDPKQAGRLRTISVSIVNEETKTIIDTCPEPMQLPDLIEELWDWLKETENTNAYARAFAFHLIAVMIHPFADGNGRTVRLCQQILLQNSGETLAQYIPTESAIMKNRREYYLSIRESRSSNSLTPMLEFLAKCYAEAAKEVVKTAKKLYLESKHKDSKTRKSQILKAAQKLKKFKLGDIQARFPDLKRKTIMRDLQDFVNSKHLRKSGTLKATTYQIIKAKP